MSEVDTTNWETFVPTGPGMIICNNGTGEYVKVRFCESVAAERDALKVELECLKEALSRADGFSFEHPAKVSVFVLRTADEVMRERMKP